MLISIITINYNNIIGLKSTFDSVLNQNFVDFEFILIDGGSVDGSKDFIIEKKESFNYWVSEPDNGIYNAMNKGIKKASGDYLIFLNSGDYLVNDDVLQRFSDMRVDEDIVYGNYKFNDGTVKIFDDKLTPFTLFRTSLPHQATFFKRELFEEIGNYDESYKICGDRELYLRSFFAGKINFKHIDLEITCFDLSGVSNTIFKQKKTEDLKLLEIYYGPFIDDFAIFMRLWHIKNKLKRLRWYSILGWLKFYLKNVKS